MARDRLIGNYGKFATAALGANVTTGTLDDEGFYIVIAIGTTSVLPATVVVGYGFTADGTEDLTGGGGDDVKLMTFTDLCDIQGWSLDLQSEETEVTTLCDEQKLYKAGRIDVSGTAEGVFTIGTTDGTGGFANSFVAIVKQVGDGNAVTVSEVDNDPIYAILFKQKDDTVGETETYYVAPIVITSFSDSVSGSDAQAFSTAFRLTNDSEVNFHLYENTID